MITFFSIEFSLYFLEILLSEELSFIAVLNMKEVWKLIQNVLLFPLKGYNRPFLELVSVIIVSKIFRLYLHEIILILLKNFSFNRRASFCGKLILIVSYHAFVLIITIISQEFQRIQFLLVNLEFLYSFFINSIFISYFLKLIKYLHSRNIMKFSA